MQRVDRIQRSHLVDSQDQNVAVYNTQGRIHRHHLVDSQEVRMLEGRIHRGRPSGGFGYSTCCNLLEIPD